MGHHHGKDGSSHEAENPKVPTFHVPEPDASADGSSMGFQQKHGANDRGLKSQTKCCAIYQEWVIHGG